MSNVGIIIYNVYNFIYALNFITILGSVLTFIIFSRKAFEKSSIGFYCKSLAISDLYVAFNLGYGIWTIILDNQLDSSYDFLCKLDYFISTGISPIPGWILVVFSFDQLIIVSRTDRFGIVKKPWFQYTLMVGIFLFHCAIYSPTFFQSGLANFTSHNQTFYTCQLFSDILPIVYLIESSLIPFAFSIVSMTLIVRILIKSRRRISLKGNALTTRKHNDFKFAFNSIILNVLFIVLSFPIIISYAIPQDDYIMSNFINTISFVFFFFNYAIHFWVHLTFNSVFRHEFLVLFRFKKRGDFGSRTSRTL